MVSTLGVSLDDNLLDIKESEEAHTSGQICSVILDAIKTAKSDFECEVVAIVSDRASNMQAGRALANTNVDAKLWEYDCQAHTHGCDIF